MTRPTIGILGLQGDIEEHIASTQRALQRMGSEGEVLVVKNSKEIEALDGLIIPGGESTVMGLLSNADKTMSKIAERLAAGMPAMATCAGVIMLARDAVDHVVGETRQPLVGALDVKVERNYFGRQSDSFEADLEIPIIGEGRFRGVFIRAPAITDIGSGVRVLSKLGGHIVAVQQGGILGLTFHPELVPDTRLHEYFLGIVSKGQM